jgi:DNA-binding NtrC family response regulator
MSHVKRPESLEVGALAPAGQRDISRGVKKSPARRVLIVDDEFLIRWSLTERLTECGCDVAVSASAAQALAAVSAAPAPFDVVLLDLRLPDSQDLGLLARLRTMLPAARLIVMTAYATPDVMRNAVDLGAFSVVSKPFEIDEVAVMVATGPLY